MHSLHAILFGIFGLSMLVGIAVLFSSRRNAIDWRLVLTGIGLQVGFAIFVIMGPQIAAALGSVAAPLKGFAKITFLVSIALEIARHLSNGTKTARITAYAAGIAAVCLLPFLPAPLKIYAPIVSLGGIALAIARHFNQSAMLGRIAGYILGISALCSLPFLGDIFDVLAKGFVSLLGFVSAGSSFVFGSMVDIPKNGFIFAFQVLPTIIFFAALMGVLYHVGFMQYIVRLMAVGITKVMRVSGAETTSVCASVFIGQTEAPLTVRPYIPKMTESELLTMMIGGMAHIAGGVMGAYIQMLGGADPVQQAIYAKHFLAASIMAAPATLLLAKILAPEVGEPLTRGEVRMHVEKSASNVIEAAAGGAADGLKLALNIACYWRSFH
jgi:concentrative nucleoside transporter, CNT family